MTDKQKDNCRLLAAFLRTDPRVRMEGRFRMGLWVGDEWRGKVDLSCGTSACAAGWATTIPELRSQGLRIIGPARDNSWVSHETIGEIFGETAHPCFSGVNPDDPDLIADALDLTADTGDIDLVCNFLDRERFLRDESSEG